MPVTQHSFSKFSSPSLSECWAISGWTCRPLAKARPHFKMRSANFLGIAHFSSGESLTGGSFFSVWAFSRISSQEPTRRSWVVSSNRYSSDKVGSLTRDDNNLGRCAFLSSSWCLMYRKTACNTTFSLSSARGIKSSVTTQSSSSASRSDKKLKGRLKNSSSSQTFEKCRRQCCLATLTSSSNV